MKMRFFILLIVWIITSLSCGAAELYLPVRPAMLVAFASAGLLALSLIYFSIPEQD